MLRIVAPLALVGIWKTASLLGGPLLVTGLLTLGAAALAAWALVALREQ